METKKDSKQLPGWAVIAILVVLIIGFFFLPKMDRWWKSL